MSTRIRLQASFKFALAMVLMYWLALWMDWDLAKYGALAIVLISLSTSGASINKGVMRVIGTAIACGVAFILIEWFSQERWNMMFALAGYLVFISYFLQTSRYPYAWYVAGFVPLIIWSDTYGGAFDNTFHFAIFRLLETAAGVLIYSLISVLLWPQTAGEQFYRQGGEYLDHLCRLVRLYRGILRGDKNGDAPTMQRQLDALSTQLQATLGASLSDNMVIRENKNEWAKALITLRALNDSVALWRTADESCRRLDPEQARPDLENALQTVEQRCTRTGELWRSRQLPGEASAGDDKPLLKALSLDFSLPCSLSTAERGLLMNRVDQMHHIDHLSRKLLLTLRVLTGLDSAAAMTDRFQPMPPDRPPRWEPERLVKSLIPALAFITGFLFWVYPSNPPPSGQSIAMMSGVIGLMVALGANVRYIALAFAAGGLLVVAPIYFIVMPWLDGGVGLLTMIFLLSFTFGYLGGRWPMVKLGGLLLFVMTTNISNDQSYSFMGWMNAEFMMVMAGLIVNVVVMFMAPIHPEKILLRRVSRFFHACAAITGGFATVKTAGTEKKKGERHLREVRVIPGELRVIEQTLDYSLFPANSQGKVNYLLDSVQSVAARMRVLQTLMERVLANGSSTPLGAELPRRLQKLFERWAKTTLATDASEEERGAIEALYDELEQRLETYHAEAEAHSYREQMAVDLTALLGGLRGLLEVMTETDRAIRDIHWQQWAEARF